MHLLKRALVVGSLALSSVVAPAAQAPAYATHCAGTVRFVAGTPTGTTQSPVEAVGTFDTQGPGFSLAHCDLGWVTTCQMWVDGTPVSAHCPTHYAPEPDRCPSAPPCGVDVRGDVSIDPLQTVTVRVRLGMKWGCCNKQGGPESVDEGEWQITRSASTPPLVDCEEWLGDICKKVRPIIKILVPDLDPIDPIDP